jgi:hypothetical protein
MREMGRVLTWLGIIAALPWSVGGCTARVERGDPKTVAQAFVQAMTSGSTDKAQRLMGVLAEGDAAKTPPERLNSALKKDFDKRCQEWQPYFASAMVVGEPRGDGPFVDVPVTGGPRGTVTLEIGPWSGGQSIGSRASTLDGGTLVVIGLGPTTVNAVAVPEAGGPCFVVDMEPQRAADTPPGARSGDSKEVK